MKLFQFYFPKSSFSVKNLFRGVQLVEISLLLQKIFNYDNGR
jgi:hypothetical protein